MAPKKPPSSSSVLRRRRASFSSIEPVDSSASIAICLPGMASRWKRAATSAMRPEPLVMTTKFTITRMMKTMMPMTKLPAMTKLPKAWMTWPAASVPSWPCARISRVEARLSASRSMVEIKKHGREGGEFERRVDEQRRHQDQHREDDRDRQRAVEQQRRQRQDQHHQNGEHADRERDVAALHEGADVAEAGQIDGAGGGRGARLRRSCRSCLGVVSAPRGRHKGASSPGRDGAWRAAARITGRDGRRPLSPGNICPFYG